ncbi:MAG: siroheme synthase, partial [Alphaproteobacteria bacterium HGW-Alphaproteobacteria-13]
IIRLAGADPDELSLRAARLLGEADHIFHGAGVPAAILDRARADAVRHVADGPPDDPPEGLTVWIAAA